MCCVCISLHAVEEEELTVYIRFTLGVHSISQHTRNTDSKLVKV